MSNTNELLMSNPCATCNGRGGVLSGEMQGDPPMTAYVEWLELCDDCIMNGACPSCSNATLTAGVYEAALDDIETFTCELCGWHIDYNRFDDGPDYDGGDDWPAREYDEELAAHLDDLRAQANASDPRLNGTLANPPIGDVPDAASYDYAADDFNYDVARERRYRRW